LATRLEETRQGDVERGYTWYGPRRADLEIRLDGRRFLGSRGQNKIIVAIMQLASQRVLAVQGVECVWLLDDLVAELAPENMSAIWGAIAGTNAQIISTALRAPLYDGAMFHVERGRVSPVS
jgi:recombinational DNA repair ATPase RecF